MPGTAIDEWFKLTPVKGVQGGSQIHLTPQFDSAKALIPSVAPADLPQSPPPVEAVLEPAGHELGMAPPEIADQVPAPESAPRPGHTGLVAISGDCGHIIDTVNPNGVTPVETRFSELRESPAKMYTADTIEELQLEQGQSIYGPSWALAKIAVFSAYRAYHYFTDFASLGCEGSTKAWLALMTSVFSESNHNVNQNRIEFATDPVIGPLVNVVVAAYEITIAALARKTTLVQARKAVNEASRLMNVIANDSEDYVRVKETLFKGYQSQKEREEGTLWSNLNGAKRESLGTNAAVSALGLSSLEHSLNCYMCN
jgi:hypothetical protein